MKGLYIHIPFCAQKCKYCDFVSFAGKETLADGYIKALKREAEEYRGERIDTIFIGGGTPSVLTAEQIREVTRICFDTFDVTADYEFTIETNPGTLDDSKITAMLDGGINRVSVGVQSFNDDELHKIGRIHDAQMAYNTIWHLKKMGFLNINLDLMTALPGQTMESLKNTLKTAVSLPVSHISAYSLIIEDGTPLEREYSKGQLILPDEDTDREMYAYTVDFLKKNGFLQYEISNFAKEGFECRHNIKYWTGEEYIGLGTAAHSYTGNERYYNTSDINAYINGAKREVTPLTRQDKISEFIITGLRMNRGISGKVFRERFGMDIKSLYGDVIKKFINLGLMRCDGESYSLTEKGIDVSNSILCEFV
ncbi:MAG: radical SAM family heme chaperone HemW [Hominilimicola sp.]